MKINPKKCVACGNCTYVCPMGAIYIDPELKRAMGDYGKTMTLLHQSDVARTYRRSGRYLQYFAYLAAKPELTRRLFSRTAIKIGTRLQQVAAR